MVKRLNNELWHCSENCPLGRFRSPRWAVCAECVQSSAQEYSGVMSVCLQEWNEDLRDDRRRGTICRDDEGIGLAILYGTDGDYLRREQVRDDG